jgi:hypothetical protein
MSIYLLAFLLIPIAAISAREIFGWKRSIWLIFFTCVLVGWLFWFLSVWSIHQQLDEIVEGTPNPPKELLDRWQNDGAANVFAMGFGWVFAAIYFLACLVFVRTAGHIKKALSKGK